MYFDIPYVSYELSAQDGFNTTDAITGRYGQTNPSLISKNSNTQLIRMAGVENSQDMIDTFGAAIVANVNSFVFIANAQTTRVLWRYVNGQYTKSLNPLAVKTINGVDYYLSYGGSSESYATGYYSSAASNKYASLSAFLNDVSFTYPITYRLTNATAEDAPVSAPSWSVVTVSLTFQEGYGIVNPSTDIYVTNNGVIVPSTYLNGILTFTMPDPS